MRIWYKARGFGTGKNVTVFFIKPSLEKSGVLKFKEWGEGLYYLDYDFCDYGPYVGKIFENEIPLLAHVFRKGSSPGIVTYNTK